MDKVTLLPLAPFILQKIAVSPIFIGIKPSSLAAPITSAERKFEMPTKPATNWFAGF